MSLDVAYSYCTNLTKEEKIEIDKQVQKNIFELKFAIFVYLPIGGFGEFIKPQVPFFPLIEGFSPQQIVRNVVQERVGPLLQILEECEEAYNEYKTYTEMSSKLLKISKLIRKDDVTKEGLDKLKEQLEKGEFHGGRGAKKLPGTKTVYYMRSGGRARLFFRYSKKDRKVIEIIGESDKDTEDRVINNIKKNYK